MTYPKSILKPDAWLYENWRQVFKDTKRHPNLVARGYTETPLYYNKRTRSRHASYTAGLRDLADMDHVSDELGNVLRDCADLIDHLDTAKSK